MGDAHPQQYFKQTTSYCFYFMFKAQAKGASPQVIAKAINLKNKVTQQDSTHYIVPGSTGNHIVTYDKKVVCDCKSIVLCSHILAVEFYIEDLSNPDRPK